MTRESSDRRSRRGPLCLALFLALLPAPGLTAGSSADESHEYRYVMGTSVQVQAFGGDEAVRRAAIDEAFAAFAEVDRLMSNYRDDSELALINHSAAHGA